MNPAAAHQRLAQIVKARRVELGLSVRDIAKQAVIDRQTWTNLEAAARTLRTTNWSKVERVLGWGPGSIAAILDGGEPTYPRLHLTMDFGALSPIVRNLVVDLDYIAHMDVPATVKAVLTHCVFTVLREAEAEIAAGRQHAATTTTDDLVDA